MRAALFAESLKLRRSRVILTISLLVTLAVPAMSYGLFWVAIEGGFGPLAAKSSGLIVGEGWEGYLSAAGQITAVAGFLAVGVATAWVFGREFVDNTFPSLFGLASSRRTIAFAKFVVTAAWAAGVVATMVAVVALLGFITSPGELTNTAAMGLFKLVGIGWISAALGLTSAAAATWGRGYLPAIGALIVVVAIAQMAVLFGTGGWFPFAVPGLLAVAGAEGVPAVNGAQIVLALGLSGGFVLATASRWSSAEAV